MLDTPEYLARAKVELFAIWATMTDAQILKLENGSVDLGHWITNVFDHHKISFVVYSHLSLNKIRSILKSYTDNYIRRIILSWEDI
jgi:hypothetical protein